MKAIILKEFGDINNLELVDLPIPEPGDGEVLIKVKAIGVNPIDIKTRKGLGFGPRLKDQMPIILGWDVAGEVLKVGTNTTEFKIGDEVFGMINIPGQGKAYAEYVTAPEINLALKPSNCTYIQAASTPLAFLTAWQVLVTNGAIKKDEKVLIHAASGGVGHFAVQIAKSIGAYVIGTSSSKNREFVLSLGADEHIDYKNQKFEEILKDIDFVFDTIGGENYSKSLKVLKKGGRIITIPSGATQNPEEQAAERGVNGKFILVQPSKKDTLQLAELLKEEKIKPHIFATYSLEKVKDAHKQMETGHTVGKIVLTL